MPKYHVLAATALILSGAGALGQTRAPNDVASCSLIADPTEQRLCLLSAQQSRPASTFDPTAQKRKMETRPPARPDALSAGAGTNAAGAKDPAPSASVGPAKPTGVPVTNWRLQIP